MRDPHDLKRFVVAQNPQFEDVLAELRAGRKRSHWMWYVSPQLCGLGHSPLAQTFGIASLDEAKAYLEHPVLGPRLRECTGLVNQVQGRTIENILGYPDNLKFRSSMTLFSRAASENQEFVDALQKYFGGETDPATLQRMR